jgi:membrane protein implicated in regulation of membrane protease activity
VVEIQVLSLSLSLSLSLFLFMELIVINIVLTSGFMSRLETKKMRANTEEEGFNSNQA